MKPNWATDSEPLSALRAGLRSDQTYLSVRSAALLAAVTTVAVGLPPAVAVDLTSASTLTQNFDGLGTTTTLPADWKMSLAGSTSPTYLASENFTSVSQESTAGATPTSGGRYNWGATSTDRAIGFMTSGSYASPNSIMVSITNVASTTLTSAAVSFDIERYRINSTSANVSFFTSTDGSSWTAQAAGDSGAFTTGSSSYTFASGTVVSKSFTLSNLSIASGASLYLRWQFTTGSSNSQGLGLDNFSMAGTFAAGTPGQYWDASSTAGVGGSGTWEATSQRWNNISDGSGTLAAFDAGQSARFAGTAGIVSIDVGGVAANAGLGFEVTGYTINGGKLTLGGADAAANEINVASGTATINANIDAKTVTSTTGLNKTGAGTLVLGGIVTGDIAVSDGMVQVTGTINGAGTVAAGKVLQIGSGAQVGSFAGDITNNGFLVFSTNAALSHNNAITGTGSVSKSGTGTLTLSAASDYSGNTAISAGVVNIRNGFALGAISGSTTVDSGAALELQGGITTGESITVSGSGVSNGGAIRSISGDNQIASSIALAAASQINVDAGRLTVGTGGLNAFAGSFAVTFGGAGETVVVGNIPSGTSTLTKTGIGSLIFKGTNAYGGQTRIEGGSLTVVNSAGLGGTALGTIVSAGGALQLDGTAGNFNLPSNESLTIDGTGVSGGGAIRNLGGSISVGAVNLGGAARINSDSGTLTVASIAGSGQALTIGGAGNVTITGLANMGTATLAMDGAGVLTLGNTTTATNGVSISNGEVIFGTSGSFATTGAGTPLTMTGGTFSLNGKNQSVAYLSGGSSIIQNKSASTASTLTVGTTSGISTFNGNLADGGAGTLAVTKTGASEQVLAGSNSYSGATQITGGVLTVSHNNALGNVAGGTSVSSGTSLQLSHPVGITVPAGEVIGIAGGGVSSGGAIRNISGNNLISGQINLTSASARINSDAGMLTTAAISGTNAALTVGGAGSVTIGGAISLGTGGITKDGAGTVTFGESNAYSGTTSISSGTLRAIKSGAFGSSSIALGAGANLYAGTAATPGAALTISNNVNVLQSPVAATSQLTAGWDFQTTSNGGTVAAAAPSSPTVFAANFGSGTIYLNGTNGASSWITATSGNELSAFAGASNNAGTGFSTSTTSPAALGLVPGSSNSANGKSLVFSVATGGADALIGSYSTQRSGSSFTTQTWAYKLDSNAASWTNLATFNVSGVDTFATQTLPALSGLTGYSSVLFRLTVTGATSNSGNNRLDNIQFVQGVSSAGGTLGSDVDGMTANYTGLVTLNGGTANVSAGANGTTVFSQGIQQTATTRLNKIGTGKVVLEGSNSYTGGTAVEAGTLQIGNGGSTGILSTNSAIRVGSGGKFAINRSNSAVQGTDFSGAAITGAGGFEQSGTGKTTLNAANTFSGGTTISRGTLVATAAREKSGPTLTSSATGTGDVTINGGVLAGSGGVGATTVNPGGTISAGSGATMPGAAGQPSADSIGTLSTGDQIWNANASGGGTYLAKFDSLSAGTAGHDVLAIDGTLNLSLSGGGKFNIVFVKSSNFSLGTFDPMATTVMTLATATSIGNGSTTYAPHTDLTDLFALDTSYLSVPDVVYKIFADNNSGGSGMSLNVQVEAAPEPTTALLLGLGGTMLLGRRRRRISGTGFLAIGRTLLGLPRDTSYLN